MLPQQAHQTGKHGRGRLCQALRACPAMRELVRCGSHDAARRLLCRVKLADAPGLPLLRRAALPCSFISEARQQQGRQ